MARWQGFVEVADRVFVARYAQWDVNVGLVLGRRGALVVDTRGSAPQGAQVLDDVRVVGRDIEVAHVVNTHVHFDHTFGNGAFETAMVHAHENVARSWAADAVRIKGLFRADPGDGPHLGYTASDVVDLLATEVRGPDRTFSTSATIDLGERVVALAFRGRGHTDGDIAVAVSDAGVTFLGDLIETSAPPSFGGDCFPLEWSETLTGHLERLELSSVVVPGHGPPVDLAFVARQRDEVALIDTVLRERHGAGMTLEEAQRTPDVRLPYELGRLSTAFRRAFQQLTPKPRGVRGAHPRTDR